MDQGETSGSYASQARGRFPLGFFLQPHVCSYENPSRYGLTTTPCPQFISTSDQGNDLKNGKWGSGLDASLSFLEWTVHIVGSSNGFLLCTTNLRENMNYIICNPVTREYLVLPQPHRVYNYVSVAFMCKGDGISLGEVRYKVVRAGVANPREFMRILEIETFSSETGEWKESSVISPSPFALVVANTQILVLDDVIYWQDPQMAILAYDTTNECVQVINLPLQTYRQGSYSISQSEGKIFFARSDSGCTEICVLEDHRGDWRMKHRVSLMTMIQQNPGSDRILVPGSICVSVRHMHPWNSQQILLELSGKPFWYDFESRKLIKIRIYHRRMLADYFLYEWPCAALPQ